MTKTSKDIAVKKLLERIKEEREVNIKNGIYSRIQINFAYNSNRIEGSRLSKEQTQFIFDTNTIGCTSCCLQFENYIPSLSCIEITC